ncbi:hypothetical protein KEM55_008500 [Ascosphaera atra]|nr:hypothetical protein KEM55_008500 [Ascosphaera atra]
MGHHVTGIIAGAVCVWTSIFRSASVPQRGNNRRSPNSPCMPGQFHDDDLTPRPHRTGPRPSTRPQGLTVDREPEAQPPVWTASPPTGAREHPGPAGDSARQLDRVTPHGREDARLTPPTVSVMHADAPVSSLRDQPGRSPSPWDRYAAMAR